MLSRLTLANAIRMLSMDAVQQANSGHPGMPMGMADIAEVLWNDFLRHNPANPAWNNRDRFILSNGHGCMLQYALLHLTGYDLTIEDLKQFRQLHSRTPGHPEFGFTPGVETTTGPLGQGLANAVGLALAEKHLAAEFNRDGLAIVDHYTYVFAGDGCLMEGISHEVCSLAGTFGLGKLILFYDDNQVSIDGDVREWFTDDTPKRFESYGWHVVPHVDGHDAEAVKKAIIAAQTETSKPTIICCKTIIGWGAPTLRGTAKTHGAPLGPEEIQRARKELSWEHIPFLIPNEIYNAWDAKNKGKKFENTWNDLFRQYQEKFPELAKEFLRRKSKQLPAQFASIFNDLLQETISKKENIATRKASQNCLNYFAKFFPELVGGSADLSESNLTEWKEAKDFSKNNPAGKYIHYGVREFGMSAMMNGMALYGGIIPFGGTFLTFSDYARNAVRLCALMQQKVIFVYSHDSIGLGEDGPTHQPIEHAASLRMIPGLSLWRPADTAETVVAWQKSLENVGPTCLLLTRQAVPFQERSAHDFENIARGGYVLLDSKNKPEIILIATGSEVELAMQAAKQLQQQNKNVRVVSMPSTDVFLLQEKSYQQSVLPNDVQVRLIIEAGSSDYWYQFAGCHGAVLGINRFGASAPAKAVFKECGLTVENILTQCEKILLASKNKSKTVCSVSL